MVNATVNPITQTSVPRRDTNNIETMAEEQRGHGTGEMDPSVIVGLACRVPGAKNPTQLWDAIVEQKDLRRKMPDDRFNVDNFYHPNGTNKGTVRNIQMLFVFGSAVY